MHSILQAIAYILHPTYYILLTIQVTLLDCSAEGDERLVEFIRHLSYEILMSSNTTPVI